MPRYCKEMLMLSNAGTKKERFWVNDDRRRRKILRSRAALPQAAGSQKLAPI